MSAQTLSRRHHGSALIMALVFLLLLGLLSASSMQSALLQERMVAASKNADAARLAAETALRVAEDRLAKGLATDFDGSGGLYQSCPDPADDRAACAAPDWRDKAGVGWRSLADYPGSDGGPAPQYIIEELAAQPGSSAVLDADQPLPTAAYYRITARGFAGGGRARAVVQSHFRRAQ